MSPGLNPAQLLCEPVRLKPRRDEEALSSVLLLQAGSPGMGGGGPGHREALSHGLPACFSRVSANVSAGQRSRCVV